MKVNEYVRTPYGIRKVKDIRIKDNYLDDGFYVEDKFIVCGHKAMQEVKSSPNIIDLIDVGDYVNGYLVTDISLDAYKDKIIFVGQRKIEESGYYRSYYNSQIKSVVTKEQFSNCEYRIGE